jgi:hypothetical protein
MSSFDSGATGFVAPMILDRKQLQIPDAFGTLPRGISIVGMASGLSLTDPGSTRIDCETEGQLVQIV